MRLNLKRNEYLILDDRHKIFVSNKRFNFLFKYNRYTESCINKKKMFHSYQLGVFKIIYSHEIKYICSLFITEGSNN